MMKIAGVLILKQGQLYASNSAYTPSSQKQETPKHIGCLSGDFIIMIY